MYSICTFCNVYFSTILLNTRDLPLRDVGESEDNLEELDQVFLGITQRVSTC